MKKKKILIVSAEYYAEISKSMESDTIDCLSKFPSFFSNNQLKHLIKVPGVFEIPITISKNLKRYHAFIALGCVIKGQTPHFDFISQASTDAIMNLSINSKKPIGNGILTCLNMKQAKARKKKGAEAANAIVSILSQK